MKKILPLALILALSMQICLAVDSTTQIASPDTKNVQATGNPQNAQADDSDENFEQYFVDDTPETSNTSTDSNAAPTTEPVANADYEIKLNGYLEFSQMEQEPEEEAIELESPSTAQVNFSKPKSVRANSLITADKKPLFSPMQNSLEAASKFSTQEYNIKPVSTAYSRKFGQFSFGTSYDSSLDSARASYTTGVFTKYEGKYFALSSVFAKNTRDYDSYSDKIYFIPELKLTKRLSLLDVMQTDVFQINKKNEVVLRYTPHMKKYADDVQFEVGVGQSFYQDDYLNSSIRFSSRFKL